MGNRSPSITLVLCGRVHRGEPALSSPREGALRLLQSWAWGRSLEGALLALASALGTMFHKNRKAVASPPDFVLL